MNLLTKVHICEIRVQTNMRAKNMTSGRCVASRVWVETGTSSADDRFAGKGWVQCEVAASWGRGSGRCSCLFRNSVAADL